MLSLLWISILAISFLYFFRESFIAELAISFVPYIIWFCILAIIIEIYIIIHESKRRRKHKSIKIFFTILITILTIWIWTLYSSEFFWFYNKNDESIRLKKNEEWIKVFYANILYKNTDYKSLQNKIIQENPDIVIMVEFSDEHESEMKEFFKENYPYINRNSRSTMLAWDVVFSKIPIENITETHIVEAWSRNYSYMKILCDKCNNDVDLYVIHTSAPVSYKNFEMRNTQIGKLLSDFLKYHNDWTPTMIIWDFNLSPWSYFYKQFTKHINMLNALSYQSPNYTRSLFQQWIFRSHIDQLFISPEIKISKIEIEKLAGSDHRSFSFQFWVN
jgi:endonuclease/exonuclease/phosphatase (EEP) superfamily protein YafD